MLKNLVLISGYGQSGKDTAAEVLVKEFGFKQFALANAVRKVAERLNPVVYHDAYGDFRYNDAIEQWGYVRGKMLYPGIRKELVNIGDGLRETLDPDIWVKRIIEEILNSLADNVTVTDVRQFNEFILLRESLDYEKFKLFYIHKKDLAPASKSEELSLEPILKLGNPIIIENNSTKNFLHQQIQTEWERNDT